MLEEMPPSPAAFATSRSSRPHPACGTHVHAAQDQTGHGKERPCLVEVALGMVVHLEARRMAKLRDIEYLKAYQVTHVKESFGATV